MDTINLLSQSNNLDTHYGLKPPKRMSIIENMAMFLFTIAVGTSNREV
jgi:hypothetical protein